MDPRLLPGDILMMPPPIPIPTTPEAVKATLEIVPGLVVEPRFINGNWYLVPVGAEDQLPDVEAMIIRDLAEEIEAGEMTMGDKCCLINALAKRKRANIEALRNMMGLLGTDKPLPITEVPPLAMVESDDAFVNALPTALSTGDPVFDFIDYSYSCFHQGVYFEPVKWAVTEFGRGFESFKIGDRVNVQLFRMSDHQPASPKFEIQLKHRLDVQGRCKSEDSWLLLSKSYPGGPDSTEWFSVLGRHQGPEYEGTCTGNDAVALSVAVNREWTPGGYAPVRENNKWYIKVEFVDKSKRHYGITLNMSYFNHEFGDIVTEVRSHSKYHRDRALMQYVRTEEIKVLDEMRVQGILNANQWAEGKAILDGFALAAPECPLPTFPTIPGFPPFPPIIPPIIPEIPEIELPPPEIEIIIEEIIIPPIVLPPPFPRKVCPYDALLEELFGGSP